MLKMQRAPGATGRTFAARDTVAFVHRHPTPRIIPHINTQRTVKGTDAALDAADMVRHQATGCQNFVTAFPIIKQACKRIQYVKLLNPTTIHNM